jgi:peptidoglycan L-alanyl-D-glutamate endopeptidase CwlK
MQYYIISGEDMGTIHRILDSAEKFDVATAPLVSATKSVNLQPKVLTPVGGKSEFKFGAASMKELEGVNSKLQQVTHLALSYCAQDFCVFDGIRTYKEQQQHVANGTSKTMQSKHLQGLAVDLVPWINGKPVWDWDGCYEIALAVDKAATELGVANKITWGGAWDRRLSDFGGDSLAYEKAVQEYRERHAGKDFIDGPHFEILP